MSEARAAEILRHLDESAQPADRDLLAHFLHHRDQYAFERLVRRHGPMVLAVCRRVVGHPQDAEDAFQAAFLVLAQKGGSVSDPDLLGNWLYGVAVRVGQKARRTAARRRAREVQVTAMPDPVAAVSEFPIDIGPVLHDELAKLPACYRDAIVLCDLRGVSRSDAAAALGVPEGTLSSRLANGRKKLADRLARRGVALSAAGIPAALAEARAVPVPETLIAKTCGLAADAAAGAVVAAEVVRLTERGFDVRKILAIGVLGAALTAAGVVFAGRPDAEPQKKNDPPKPEVAKALEVKAEGVKFTNEPRLTQRFDVGFDAHSQIFWNATGTRLALEGMVGTHGPDGKFTRRADAFRVFTLDKAAQIVAWNDGGRTLVGFAPDGIGTMTEVREYDLLAGIHAITFWRPIDGRPLEYARSGRDLELTADRTTGYAFAPDGKSFRTIGYEQNAARELVKQDVREVDATTGKVRKVLLTTGVGKSALSANGKRFAVFEGSTKLSCYDVDAGTLLFSKELFPNSTTGRAPWPVVLSPDGRLVIVADGFGRTAILKTDSGDELPALDDCADASLIARPHAFTGDGRLIAVNVYRAGKLIPKKGTGSFGGGPRGQAQESHLAVFDTQTGKLVKAWKKGAVVAFGPGRPILATLESNGDHSRLGLWDFTADEK